MKRKREVLKKYAWLIKIIIKFSKVLPRRFYIMIYRFIMPHQNFLAVFLRYICLKNCTKKCGENVAIFSNVYLYNIQNLELGDNVSIHSMCYIEASGGISIGRDVSVAHGTTIMSEEHLFSDLATNIKDQGCEYKKTLIDNNVWIAAGCRILAGSIINSGSIIAAGAVVKGSIENDIVAGGVPAKVIKRRS